MTEIYVFDRSLNFLGIVDEFTSVIWRPSYSEVGDFELYLPASDKMSELLKENRYAVRKSDIHTDTSGNVTYRKVMIIKNIQLTTDAENGDFMTVTGRELKFILRQRIVWKQTTLTGTAENAVRQLVNGNAITPELESRKIPGLTLGDAAGLSDSIEKQVTGEYLDEVITEICTAYNYGWDIYLYNTQLVFTVYQGIDRSFGQTDRPYVVFGDEFDNLYNSEYQMNTEEFANAALVGGDGEGTERIFASVGDENSGFDRYEIFIDSKNTNRNSGSEDEIPLSTYLTLLKEEGTETLAGLSYTEGFTGEVLSDISFQFGEDFDLGDLITVKTKYGFTQNVRVISAIESEDESGVKLVPQFNI